MLKIKVISEKRTHFGIERQSDILEDMYILNYNESTSSEINNNFSEVLSPILGYHQAQNQNHVKKTDKSRNWPTIGANKGLRHPLKQWQYIIRNKQQYPRGIQSNPEVSSCSKRRLYQKIRQVSEINDNLTLQRSCTSSKTMQIHFQK